MIDKNKQRKWICPVHDNEFRMLSPDVSLALCSICYKMMIPADGKLASTNLQTMEGLDKWHHQKK